MIGWRHEVPPTGRATASREEADEGDDAESLRRAFEAGDQAGRSQGCSKVAVTLSAAGNYPFRTREVVKSSHRRLCDPLEMWWARCLDGGRVLRVNTYGFYDLGGNLGFAEEVNEGSKYGDVWYQLDKARDAVQALLDNKIVPVKTCRVSGQGVVDAITSIVPASFSEASKRDKEAIVQVWLIYGLHAAIREFKTVLSAELNLLDTYSVSQKGAYSTSDLIEQAELLIPESIRGLLPEQAKTDIQQAGKCIAYDVPTGAAFHILRAIESVIRAYYQHVTGNLPKPKMRNWGAYINNLRKAGGDEKIVGYIEHLKERYRNPVFHPEDNLTPEEAQMFLGACISGICQMLIAIRDTAPNLAAMPNTAALASATLTKFLGLGAPPPPPDPAETPSA